MAADFGSGTLFLQCSDAPSIVSCSIISIEPRMTPEKETPDAAEVAPVQSESQRISATIAERVAMEKRRKRAFRLLFLCLICLGMGHTIMFANLPPLARELGISESLTSAVFSLSAAIWVFMSPFWGRRSEFMGRRPVILIGLSGYAISTILLASVLWAGLAGVIAFGIVYPLMIATRTVYGTLGPGAMAASQAYVADRTSRLDRTKELASITAAFGLGMVIGPGVGGIVASLFGLISPFYFVAGLAVISGFAVWRYLPEKTAPRMREETPRINPLDPRFRSFIGYSFLLGITGAIPIQTVSFYMIDKLALDFGGGAHGAEPGFVALTVLAMSTLFAQLVIVQRVHMTARQMIFYGCVSIILGALTFALSLDFSALIFGLVLIGIGLGLSRPGIMGAASLSALRSEQGAVTGLVGGMGAASFIVIPFLMQIFYTRDPAYMFVVQMALAVVVLLATWIDPAFKRAEVEVEDETPPLEV